MSNGEVFIVDDDWAVGDALSIVLSLEGYQPKTFAEGQAFLAAARARTPACIILDVHMPGRSGLDILKDLNAQDYPAPILIISGQGITRMGWDGGCRLIGVQNLYRCHTRILAIRSR